MTNGTALAPGSEPPATAVSPADDLARERRATTAVALCLFTFLIAVYLLTYAGVPYVGDEFGLAASVESLVKWGTLSVNQLYASGYVQGAFEPLQILLAAPLYWAAWQLPHIGNLQALYLFNVVVTALTGALIVFLLRRLAYSLTVSVVVALAYGLGTTAWVYSKTFFREPLAALLLLLAAYFLLALRPAPLMQRSAGYGLAQGALAAVALVLATATKEASAVVVPIFGGYGVFYLFQSARTSPAHLRRWLPIVVGGLSALAVTLAALILYNWLYLGTAPLGARNILGQIGAGLELNPVAVQTLLTMPLNPGKGLFTHAPVLLAALASPLLLLRRKNLPEILLPLLVTFAFMWLYAHAYFWIWWGGRSWGARYLVPTMPFLAVALAPVVDRVLTSRSRLLKVSFAFLCLFSIASQIGGVTVGLDAYAQELAKVSSDAPWTLAIYDGFYSEVIGHLRILRLETLDLPWLQVVDGQVRFELGVLVLTVLTASLAAVGLVHFIRNRATGRQVRALALLALCVPTLLAGVSLYRYYDDPRYRREKEWFTLLDYLVRQEEPGDALIVNVPTHSEFFLNYNKTRMPWYGLGKESWPLAHEGPLPDLLKARRIWLATEFFPESDPSRGVERWLDEHAYKISDTQFGYPARLTLFVTAAAPVPALADLSPVATFGGVIDLLAPLYSPGPLRPGDVLTATLLWRATSPLSQDYSVSLQLLDDAGSVRAQIDRYPVDNFRPTTGWTLNEVIRDNYGLVLPADLHTGRYRLVVTLYQWTTMKHLPVTGRPPGQDSGLFLLGDVPVGLSVPATPHPYPMTTK